MQGGQYTILFMSFIAQFVTAAGVATAGASLAGPDSPALPALPTVPAASYPILVLPGQKNPNNLAEVASEMEHMLRTPFTENATRAVGFKGIVIAAQPNDFLPLVPAPVSATMSRGVFGAYFPAYRFLGMNFANACTNTGQCRIDEVAERSSHHELSHALGRLKKDGHELHDHPGFEAAYLKDVEMILGKRDRDAKAEQGKIAQTLDQECKSKPDQLWNLMDKKSCGALNRSDLRNMMDMHYNLADALEGRHPWGLPVDLHFLPGLTPAREGPGHGGLLLSARREAFAELMGRELLDRRQPFDPAAPILSGQLQVERNDLRQVMPNARAWIQEALVEQQKIHGPHQPFVEAPTNVIAAPKNISGPIPDYAP